MGLIKLIKRILYNFRKKSLISIIIILFMLLVTMSNFSKVFAVADFQNPDNVDYTYEFITNQIFFKLNVDTHPDGKEAINFCFRDDNSQAYRLIYIDTGANTLASRFGLYDYPWGTANDDLTKFKVGAGNNCPMYLYTVFDSGEVELTKSINVTGWQTVDFNTYFNLNCFSIYTFLYSSTNNTYNAFDKIMNWNDLYSKSTPIIPFNEWNENSLFFDDYMIINPGNTYYQQGFQAPFIIEVQDKNSNVILRYLMDYNSLTYDATSNTYKIPKSWLDFDLDFDTDYTFYVELYTNNNFYYKERMFDVTWGENPVSPDAPRWWRR